MATLAFCSTTYSASERLAKLSLTQMSCIRRPSAATRLSSRMQYPPEFF
jgi:hypothetical protein